MRELLAAVAATFSGMVVVFFLRFWRDSRDRFFLFFAAAFFFFTLHWALLATVHTGEHVLFHYVLRLLGFVLILAAIADKNLQARKRR